MALSCSLATMAVIGLVSLAGTPGAPCGDDGIAVVSIPQAGQLERIANEANELKNASKWDDFRSKLKHAEQVHREQSEALAEQRKILDQAQKDLDAALARIERPQVMLQALLAEVQDLDDDVLKAACQRMNAEGILPIQSGRPGHEPVIYSLNSEQAGRLLAVIEKRRPTQIVSRPSILATEGQVAEILVGQKVKKPVAAKANSRDDLQIDSLEWKEETVGLAVSVTPSIRDNRQIRLDLIVDDSSLSGDPFGIFVEEKNGKTIGSPVVNRAKLQTTLAMADGRTVLVAVRARKPTDEIDPTKTTLILLTPRVVDRTAAAGEILHH